MGTSCAPGCGTRWGRSGEAMNAGQIYVTLGRLEKAGLVTCELEAGQGPDRKVYAADGSGPAAGSRVAGRGGLARVWPRRNFISSWPLPRPGGWPIPSRS